VLNHYDIGRTSHPDHTGFLDSIKRRAQLLAAEVYPSIIRPWGSQTLSSY